MYFNNSYCRANQFIIFWVPKVLSNHKNYLASGRKERFNLFEVDLTSKRYKFPKHRKLRNRTHKPDIAGDNY